MIHLNGHDYICPIDTALSFISGKWKILILSHLAVSQSTRRFGELRDALPGITEKMLAQQLKELERDGLIAKKIYPVSPPKVEYSVTELGASLMPLFTFLSEWGMQYLQQHGIDYLKDQQLYK